MYRNTSLPIPRSSPFLTCFEDACRFPSYHKKRMLQSVSACPSYALHHSVYHYTDIIAHIFLCGNSPHYKTTNIYAGSEALICTIQSCFSCAWQKGAKLFFLTLPGHGFCISEFAKNKNEDWQKAVDEKQLSCKNPSKESFLSGILWEACSS